MRGRRRIVDARYLSPSIPATTPPPFGVADGVHAVAVNDLVKLGGAPSEYVIVGSGKTATDACIWLLDNGVDPGAICWVRPRDPWMLNRAVVQPDPVVFLGMAADIMEAAAAAAIAGRRVLPAGGRRRDAAHRPVRDSHDGEDADARPVGARPAAHDRPRRPARPPPARASRAGWCSTEGEVAIARDAVVVHCAASGLQYPPLVPIWGREAITLQPIRTGFPCFGAALAGYVEATLEDDDARRTGSARPRRSPTRRPTGRACRCSAVGRRPFAAYPDIRAWADRVRSTRRASHRSWPAPPQ